MILAYAVIAVLGASNVVTLIIMYKLVTQLSSKVMAGNLPTYAAATTPTSPVKTPGARPLSSGAPVSINDADPNDIMESIATQVGRIDEFRRIN